MMLTTDNHSFWCIRFFCTALLPFMIHGARDLTHTAFGMQNILHLRAISPIPEKDQVLEIPGGYFK